MEKIVRKHYPSIFLAILFLSIVISIVIWYFRNHTIAVLHPQGPIALKEYHLIVFALLLSLLIVIPVFALMIGFAWRYREGNKKAKYSPNLDGNRFAETIWWLIPSALILVLAIVAWNSSHQLDPYKPLVSSKKPITIQVVALNWKWLFIYPQQNIASVNLVQFPKNTPVNFEITSDAPMNSFWIPELGGQIYAMPGMSTQLNLLASNDGSYNGSSANISGVGFSGMTFIARSTDQSGFESWVKNVRRSPNPLSLAQYNMLSAPSQNNKVAYYSSTKPGLYNGIVNKYMTPSGGPGSQTQNSPNQQGTNSSSMSGMDMNGSNMQGMDMQ